MSRDLTIDPKATVVTKAILEGSITIGAGTVVHPMAVIKATNGPIIIGENCLVEEQVLIENLNSEPMKIGDNNVFEVRCVVRAVSVGNNNVFGVGSVVKEGVVVSDGCSVGVKCQVSHSGVTPTRSVIYGCEGAERRAIDDPPSHSRQLEMLQKLFLNYHHLIKDEKSKE